MAGADVAARTIKQRSAGYPPNVMLIRPPGVYSPQLDTWLLVRALAEAGVPRGGHAVDVCTGTGALAVAAAYTGAARVTAVDVSRSAVVSAWLNCRLRGIDAEVLRGDFAAVLGGRSFDLVLANPPYVPAPEGTDSRGVARAWDAGAGGRAILDQLCAALPTLLKPRGVALIVHSALSDPDSTLAQLRERELKAAIVARATVPFGPVLRRRAQWLESAGLIGPGQRMEDLVVIRADRIRQ
ncbi:HemK2/MTQ2 family protein methyltransferase [Nocardia gamkensis]|nr:HemK2/MTQ2 family protein methyltransferase [Nocardia gamkensis]NQE72015.1 Peptide chain release factor N(5)-glutamine methyltransferase [Nocardia gamkensis]